MSESLTDFDVISKGGSEQINKWRDTVLMSEFDNVAALYHIGSVGRSLDFVVIRQTIRMTGR
jgi:hypothetical protein